MPKRNIIWVVAIVAAALVTLYVVRREPVYVSDPDAEGFRPVQRAYRLIRTKYYQPVDGIELRRAAVRGMVEGLDRYGAYLSPENADAFERRVTRGFERGLGLDIQVVDGRVTIARVQVNSPAHRAKLFPGDRIVAVDGEDPGTLALREIEQLLDGPVEEEVTLKIVRDGGKAKSFALRRSEFRIESIEGLYRDEDGEWVYLVDPGTGIAYIRIKELVTETDKRFQLIFTRLGAPRGLILDLRDNLGGTLEVAVKVGDMFLREGLIVATVGQDGKLRRHEAYSKGTYPDILIVMLINARTASAAEVVCGSLRLHNRAVLIGTRTRGKGCVQSVIPLSGDLGKISLTTAEFYLGRLGTITRQPGSDRWGIDPHVQVIILPSRQAQLDQLRRRASALRRPQPQTGPATTLPTGEKMVEEFLGLDSQLSCAVTLLGEPGEIDAILEKAAEEAKLTEESLREEKTGHAD